MEHTGGVGALAQCVLPKAEGSGHCGSASSAGPGLPSLHEVGLCLLRSHVG